MWILCKAKIPRQARYDKAFINSTKKPQITAILYLTVAILFVYCTSLTFKYLR